MKMFKLYEKKHTPCVQAYEDYLKKIKLDTEEYMNELYAENRYDDIKSFEATSQQGTNAESVSAADNQENNTSNRDSYDSENLLTVKENQEQRQNEQKIDTLPVDTEEVVQVSANDENEITKQVTDEMVCQCGVIEAEDIVIDTDINLTLEVNKERKCSCQKDESRKVCLCVPQKEPEYTVCICQNIDPSECDCGNVSSETESEPEPEPEPPLKRFTILNKIPCKLKEQLEILKKTLEVLAEDGFPLAKLPESYKLPHFKLWMQLRCGKFWTQEERVPLLMDSFSMWKHTGCCTVRRIKSPHLDISKAEACKYTWAQAEYIKQITTEKDLMYYRQLRQANIGDGHEFFPTTHSYELPTPNFRDCYFAYVSSKEEDCICWRPWYSHEVKDLSARKSCY